jgi:NAD-dependent histone deacetylase SIR2
VFCASSSAWAHSSVSATLCQLLLPSATTILFLCFPLKDFRSPGGLYSARFPHNGQVMHGHEMFNVATIQNAEKLVIFNQFMTRLRIQARTAPLTAFHQWIIQLSKQGRLQRCYTQNFDGLQTRDHPELQSKVYELHGSNSQLYCPACNQQPEEPADSFDQQYLEDGIVKCPHCLKRGM